MQRNVQYRMVRAIFELVNVIFRRTIPTPILDDDLSQMTQRGAGDNVAAILFEGSLLELYFHHLTGHNVYFNPYVDETNLHIWHVEDFIDDLEKNLDWDKCTEYSSGTSSTGRGRTSSRPWKSSAIHAYSVNKLDSLGGVQGSFESHLSTIQRAW